MAHHLIDLRCAGYRGGYLDPDLRMVFACLRIFEEFYAKEYPGPVEWDRKVAREIEALHAWWRRGRREVERRSERLLKDGVLPGPRSVKIPGTPYRRDNVRWRSPAAKRKWWAASKVALAQDQKMLMRLMAIRKHLWT